VFVALTLLILWMIAELLVAIQVAHAIGALATIVLMIAAWPIGTWTLRSQGRAAWRRLTAAVAEGRTPTGEMVDGAMVVIGGSMLIVPGFITDAIGAVLLLPPTRALLRPLLVRYLHSRFAIRTARYARVGSRHDVDSTATDIDQPQLRS
jgi:UPF0716 protein FxsA